MFNTFLKVAAVPFRRRIFLKRNRSKRKHNVKVDEGLRDIEAWYFTLKLDPDNVDWDEAIKDCLVKAKILDSGSGVDDMKQKMASGDLVLQSQEAATCFTDPLGKLQGE